MLILVHLCEIRRVEINLGRLDDLGLVYQLPAKVEDWKDKDGHVREEEIGDIPVSFNGQENSVTANKSHDESSNESIPSSIRHEPGSIGESVTADSLCLEGSVPEHVGDGNTRKVDELRSRDKRDEPVQNNRGVCGKLQKGQQSNGQNDTDAVDRHTGLGASGEESGHLSFEGKTVERSRGTVDVRVTGRKGREKNHGVDDVGENVDTETVHGNDIGGGSGTGFAVLESR